MKHVVRSVALTAVAALVASVAFALPAQASTIYVGPGQSIQAAVDSASPGDTIIVRPGVYRENVHINKDRITLKGSGPTSSGTELLSPANPPKGPFGGNGISIFGKVDMKTGKILRRSKGVRISGFLIKGYRDSGIFGYGADNFTFLNNRVVDNGGYGIVVFNQRDGEYLDNVAIGSHEAGFYVGDAPHADFLGRGNVAIGNQFGFFIRDASHGHVNHNTATGNFMGFLVLDTGSPGPAIVSFLHS